MEDQPLDVHSWLVVITFMIVIVIVIRPIRISLPTPAFSSFSSSSLFHPLSNQSTAQQQQQQEGDYNSDDASPNSAQGPSTTPIATATNLKQKISYHFTLNIATAPVLGVLFLLATRSIEGDSVRDGIVGAPGSGVEPYAVMILFFSLAVDLLTPIAFLMAEIQTANIASMALYIGNLTNVVACQAYKVSFLEYSAWMLLPCFAAVATCYIMLRINFRHEKYIPKIVKTPNVDPRSCLVDPVGAIFGLSVLACSLICLIGTSFAHVSVWIVTGPFALLTLARDIWYDSQGKFKPAQVAVGSLSDRQLGDSGSMTGGGGVETAAESEESRLEKGLPEIAVPEPSIVRPVSILTEKDNGKLEDDQESVETVGVSYIPVIIPTPTTMTITDNNINNQASSEDTIHQSWARKFSRKFEQKSPLLHAIAIRMPWAILPFTFSMFIMVEGLSHSGWIAIFANWATKLVPNYVAATYAIGFVSVLLCNIFNNVPMTILVARILQHPNFVDSPLATPEVIKGCLFALIVGSNLGACTTLISSLAGLMWDSVLRSKGSGVGFWNFFRWNMGVMPVVILVTLTVVVIELTVIF
ncbi:hypothetical protein EC957_011770 [Mortierella hygrophila]|uniref:Citrate transporter-like domain-containing protein n=1 Tax=Mortierella hygrophila TaxID=979708 RepID=A0A9P6F8Z1_9FUNG|nr:hypothetical protein EC957_011770 [Mortierella hygrophila]